MIDPVAAVVEYLSAQTALAALATGGIYGEELPQGTVPPCVCVRSKGGQAAAHAPIQYAEVSIACYADRPTTARALDMLAREVLEVARVPCDGEGILYADVATIGDHATDSDWPEWAVVEGEYEVAVHSGDTI